MKNRMKGDLGFDEDLFYTFWYKLHKFNSHKTWFVDIAGFE